MPTGILIASRWPLFTDISNSAAISIISKEVEDEWEEEEDGEHEDKQDEKKEIGHFGWKVSGRGNWGT